MAGIKSKIDLTENSSLRSRIFNRICNDILNGKYKPGDALVETKLSEELGVSRTPVREAIRQLELEGIVVSVPNKGVFVTGISEQDVDDIFDIRLTIERLAVRWAIERIDDDEIDELKEIVGLMEYYTSKGELEHVSELDTKFHDVIYNASKSMVLKHTLSSLLRFVQRARLGSLKVPKRAELSFKEHSKILNAMLEKNVEEAEKLMTEHISHANYNLKTHKNG